MADIQLPSTLGTATGTGKLMKAYSLTGDSGLYIEDAATGVPAKLLFKRTDPKPTRNYAGAGKSEVRFTESWADAQGVQWPVVFSATSSIPDGMSAADKVAFITRAVLATEMATARDVLSKRLIPQS